MAGQQLDAQKLMEQLEQLPLPARVGIYAGVAVAVLGLYYFAFHGSVQKRLHVAEVQLAKLEGEIAEARAVAANLETFRKQSEELKEELRAALEQLPNAAELPVLLTDISSLGKKTGLEFRAFKPQPEIERDFYAEVPINVEFVGKYHEAGVFLDKLARLPRIVNVTEIKMTLTSKQGSDPSPDLTMKGIATTFRFVERKGPPAGGPGKLPPGPKRGT